eukprot:TRINITY_DN110775_c0_g1_i1.p1 TRINITY_DN110775_c0_g1~~TRINITY_DN110775_c0_g1_i1.p1  ORF type:complete len:344 (-),score=43.14 TRINITY_DN110775_c0_g1_i1:53-1030(-)
MEVISGVSMGLASVGFWKKDFALRDMKIVVPLLMTTRLCQSNVVLATIVFAIVVAFVWDGTTFGIVGAASCKNWRMFALVSVLWMVCQLKVLSTSWHFACAAMAAGSLQLLRRPESLKFKLREWRVASGPVYTIAATLSLRYKLHETGSIIVAMLALVGACSVCLAGIAFRPDNVVLDTAVLDIFPVNLVPWPTQYQLRVKCHGLLMVFSMTIMAILLATDHAWLLLSCCMMLLLMETIRRLRLNPWGRTSTENGPGSKRLAGNADPSSSCWGGGRSTRSREWLLHQTMPEQPGAGFIRVLKGVQEIAANYCVHSSLTGTHEQFI